MKMQLRFCSHKPSAPQVEMRNREQQSKRSKDSPWYHCEYNYFQKSIIYFPLIIIYLERERCFLATLSPAPLNPLCTTSLAYLFPPSVCGFVLLCWKMGEGIWPGRNSKQRNHSPKLLTIRWTLNHICIPRAWINLSLPGGALPAPLGALPFG